MKRRFDANENGDFVDRHGYPLMLSDLRRYPTVSMVLDMPSDWPSVGGPLGGGGTSELSEQQELTPTNPQDGGVGEGGTADATSVVWAIGDPAAAVWATYVEAMEPRDKVLHPAERKLIKEALKVATVVECQTAIWGCRRSPFHMGDNAKRKKYNRLSHILKGKRGVRTLREQIDFMLDLADKHGVGDVAHAEQDAAVDPSKLARMRRAIFRGHDMPGSDQAQEQMERAERWLQDHGWQVIRNGNDRPKIERQEM